MHVCVACACLCVRACACAGVCVCVWVSCLYTHTHNTHTPLTHSCNTHTPLTHPNHPNPNPHPTHHSLHNLTVIVTHWHITHAHTTHSHSTCALSQPYLMHKHGSLGRSIDTCTFWVFFYSFLFYFYKKHLWRNLAMKLIWIWLRNLIYDIYMGWCACKYIVNSKYSRKLHDVTLYQT